MNLVFNGEYQGSLQLIDSIRKHTTIETVENDSLISFDFLIRACGADGGHTARLVIDSINVVDFQATGIFHKDFANNILTVYNSGNNYTFSITENTPDVKELEILDVTGKLVQKTNINNQKTINLSHLKNGIYLARIRNYGTQKFFKY